MPFRQTSGICSDRMMIPLSLGCRLFWDTPVMGVWFWCTDQSMVQPVLAAKSLKEGQLGTNFTGWLKILDVPLYILPGIICLALFPQLENPDEAEYDDGNPFVSCRDGGAGVGCVDCRACQYYRIGIECFEYRVYNGYLCEEDSPAGEAEGDHPGRTSGDGSRSSDIGNHNDCH